jgi:hypothetical protein
MIGRSQFEAFGGNRAGKINSKRLGRVMRGEIQSKVVYYTKTSEKNTFFCLRTSIYEDLLQLYGYFLVHTKSQQRFEQYNFVFYVFFFQMANA